jgi:hypothetical protein
MKSAIIAEELLADLYTKATEPDASFHTALELAKFAARAAGIDAPVKEQSSSVGFSISINLGNGQSVQIGATTHQAALQDVYDSDDSPVAQTMSFTAYTPTPIPA